MIPEFIDCDQNSPEWFAARCGIPTASRFKDILAKGEGKTRAKYLRQLAGEIVTGAPAEGHSNAHMERGHAMEPEARSAYAFMHDADPMPVGFVRRGRAGASPDSILGTGGLLEIKTKLPDLLIECMLRDDFPPEHKAQVQGQLWVAERDWCDLAVYWPGMPLVVFRAQRDEAYIKTLASAVQAFTEELDALVERIRAWGDPGATKRAFRASVGSEVILGDVRIA
jgi:hypothetical protein